LLKTSEIVLKISLFCFPSIVNEKWSSKVTAYEF
jgi:hypothetical protein